MPISIEFNTSEKLRALIGQIDKLLLSDFPHAASKEALTTLKAFFEAYLIRLERATKSKEPYVLARTCIAINERIYQYLPVLGFLLRSTHVRNSFEVYHLLLSYAKRLIGRDAQFVLSSEWDFSPLTYAMTVSALPHYVMVGLPSSESANALIIPLSGHELGHSVWVNENLEAEYASRIEDALVDHISNDWPAFREAFPEHAKQPVPRRETFEDDIFLSQNLETASLLAQSHIEEIYCDGLGLSLFGKSYAYAFHYLLAPNMGTERSPLYPSLTARASYMTRFGGTSFFGVASAGYDAEFSATDLSLTSREALLLKAADFVSESFAEELYDRASAFAESKVKTLLPNARREAAVLKRFQEGIPADSSGSLADILNAGWDYVLDEKDTFSADRPIVDWISELILKSAEVLEYRDRLKRA